MYELGKKVENASSKPDFLIFFTRMKKRGSIRQKKFQEVHRSHRRKFSRCKSLPFMLMTSGFVVCSPYFLMGFTSRATFVLRQFYECFTSFLVSRYHLAIFIFRALINESLVTVFHSHLRHIEQAVSFDFSNFATRPFSRFACIYFFSAPDALTF